MIAPKKQALALDQAMLKPIDFCWADEEFGDDFIIPTDKVVGQGKRVTPWNNVVTRC